MIPKTIHYCWFGGASLDAKSKKCIESWKTYFPDYQIVRWDERNFDINQIPFMKEAYEHHKWAFVSDVARIIIVYQYGGIYFDTDVEVIASYEDILAESPNGFFGFEVTGYVNSGLGFAAEKGNLFLAELIEKYKDISFSACINSLERIACPIIMTELMKNQGYAVADRFQTFREFSIYPTSYFSPLDYDTGKLELRKETHSIHWGNASWNDEASRQMRSSIQRYNRIFGKMIGEKLFGIQSCLKEEGIVHYVKRHFLPR